MQTPDPTTADAIRARFAKVCLSMTRGGARDRRRGILRQCVRRRANNDAARAEEVEGITMGAGGAVAAYPLFQTEGGGAIPTSALQLTVERCPKHTAVELNAQWHSRLPEIGNWQGCMAFSAEFDGMIYAVALWSLPVARLFNGRNYLELRRMAVCSSAPKNTASRFLAVMTRIIKKENPSIVKLISYQDCAVHQGTIYKAAGWTPVSKPRFRTWKNRIGRIDQTSGPKVRWELAL